MVLLSATEIAVGVILALAVSIIGFVWNNDFYSKTQQWIICVFILFFPAMVGLLIIFSLYNHYGTRTKSFVSKKSTAAVSVILKQLKGDVSGRAIDKLNKLNQLHKDGIISPEEFEKLKKDLKKDLNL